MSSSAKTLDAGLAAAIATRVTGASPNFVRRFTTGTRHYVFDIGFIDHPPIVVRLGDPSARAELGGAPYLSTALRPRGVQLPKILAEDIRAEFPWMAMERLPGTDLGNVIASLPQVQLNLIAAEVVRAQAITAQTGSAGRYGYAILPEQAPHESWSGVLEDSLSRSQARMATALFDAGLIHLVRAKLAVFQERLGVVAPTPFLHDTTTKNVIVTPDGRFSGLVDVDDLCFGDARYPAALTLAVMLAYGGPVDYVASWMHQSGQAEDSVFQLYVAIFLLDLMSEHGQNFNGNQAPSTPNARNLLAQALMETLKLVK